MQTLPLPSAILDAHHHLWRLGDDARYPWLQENYDPQAFFLGDYAALRGDFGPDAYLGRWAGLPLAATVHVEAERHPAESLAETGWLHRIHATHGFPNAVVAHADFNSAELEEQVLAQIAFPLVRGVRCKPLTSRRAGLSVRGLPGTLQDGRWLQGLGLLAEHGLSWDLRVPFWHLQEAAEAVAMFPALQVVLEHTGLPWDRSGEGLAVWRRGMEALAQLPNVHVKLSEFGLPDAPWDRAGNVLVIRQALDIFGWQRCMFAGNLPVSGLRAGIGEVVATVAEALDGLAPTSAHAVWCGNALRFYRIDTQGEDATGHALRQAQPTE
ncbi:MULTISPECIES: amidohydrolase family protein [Cupriavidus]|uniref:amidohydrolase family protein n=1 Tax=Cupriavidus TaxID=106589 RepID=UPI0023E7C0D1|nr:amidohydrolase family protein [Cupriavidus basilensis]MDF3888390.1 amidohydrolase family protein [Cupriavidus basilensis]